MKGQGTTHGKPEVGGGRVAGGEQGRGGGKNNGRRLSGMKKKKGHWAGKG